MFNIIIHQLQETSFVITPKDKQDADALRCAEFERYKLGVIEDIIGFLIEEKYQVLVFTTNPIIINKRLQMSVKSFHFNSNILKEFMQSLYFLISHVSVHLTF